MYIQHMLMLVIESTFVTISSFLLMALYDPAVKHSMFILVLKYYPVVLI